MIGGGAASSLGPLVPKTVLNTRNRSKTRGLWLRGGFMARDTIDVMYMKLMNDMAIQLINPPSQFVFLKNHKTNWLRFTTSTNVFSVEPQGFLKGKPEAHLFTKNTEQRIRMPVKKYKSTNENISPVFFWASNSFCARRPILHWIRRPIQSPNPEFGAKYLKKFGAIPDFYQSSFHYLFKPG